MDIALLLSVPDKKEDGNSEKKKNYLGLYIGIAVAVLFVLLLLWYYRRKNNSNYRNSKMDKELQQGGQNTKQGGSRNTARRSQTQNKVVQNTTRRHKTRWFKNTARRHKTKWHKNAAGRHKTKWHKNKVAQKHSNNRNPDKEQNRVVKTRKKIKKPRFLIL